MESSECQNDDSRDQSHRFVPTADLAVRQKAEYLLLPFGILGEDRHLVLTPMWAKVYHIPR